MYLTIHTERPGMLLGAFGAAMVALVLWAASESVAAVGGEEPLPVPSSHALEQRLYDLHAEETVRARRESILREQLSVLDQALQGHDDSPLLDEYRTVRSDLLALLLDRRRAEQEIVLSIHELWDAEGYAKRASKRPHDGQRVQFEWPVEPLLGISAHFDDPSYRVRFGFPHKAIDIPVNQDSLVRSAADGVVEKISDQGYGFNSIVIRHAGGYAILYGHVSAFLVSEGDTVSRGDSIAKSGGMPGSLGAGRMTTGPHLHLELFKDGAQIDPLPLLPARQTAE